MNKIEKLEWMILCTACGKNPWYFNVPHLHYEWTGGELTTDKWKIWYKPLLSSFNKKYIKAYVDHYTPTKRDSNLFNISYIEVNKIDFRRRMHFRATRKGWAAYRKNIKNGKQCPDIAKAGGYWIVGDSVNGKTWKENIYGEKLS